jgi:amidase
MTRTVRDAALLLSAMMGVDLRDAATSASRGQVPADLAAGLEDATLAGARIGVLRGPFAGYSPAADKVFDAAIQKMQAAGAVIVDPIELPHAGKYDGSELDVLEYEFKAGLNAYLAARSNMPVKTLAEVMAFNEQRKDAEMPHFGQELFLASEKKGPLTDAAYKDALAKNRRMSRAEGIDAVLKQHRLVALVALSGGPAWTTDLVNGDHYLGSSTTPAAVAGYPSITVPAGDVAGLPIGISFFGTAWTEPALIKLAFAFEQATKARKIPPLR